MKLIIAEKPELGRAVAEALNGNKNFSEHNGRIDVGEYCITWAFGHLLSLVEPESYDKKYADRKNIDVLPVYFENWKKTPSPDIIKKDTVIVDNSYKRARLSLIGKLLKQCDYVVNCGDPDDEGQLLIDEILEYFNYNGQVLRVLINDNLPENILKQFNELEDNVKFAPLGNAAYARQMADKCFGINHTRLATNRLNKFLTVGRVQTPTLNLVVMRDNAIKNHIKQKHYILTATTDINNQTLDFTFEPTKDFLDGQKYILDPAPLNKIKNDIENRTQSITFTTTEVSSAPPLPFNATELQAEMNAKYGYSLSDTIAITQTLRDKHQAITYNRSDCQYLKTEHYDNAPTVIPIILENIQMDYPVDYSIKSKCFDDSKISAHHGIIPQNKKINLSSLSEKEKNVYIAICERYIMQFLPPIIKKVCKSVFSHKNGNFVYTATAIIDEGYKKYFKSTQNDDTTEKNENNLLLPSGNYSGVVKNSNILEKFTKPLTKYTPKSLVKDMCSISKYVNDPILKKALKDKDADKAGENGSIGTVATRGIIVDNLIQRGFLEMKGKNIVSTQLGQEFCALLPDEIKKPDLTAKWWLIQEQVKTNSKDVNAIMLSVVEEFKKHKNTAYVNVTLSDTALKNASNSVGECPCCSAKLFTSKKNIYCSNYKNGCKFSIPFEICSKKLTDTQIQMLIKSLRTKVIKNFTSKSGKKFDAALRLDKQTGKISFEFTNSKK